MVGMGLFTAIVLILQLMGSVIRFGVFSISLVLVPVVVGAALYGRKAGAWLGFVFGVAVLLSGDATVFLTIHQLGTIVTVLAKGTLAGFMAGLVYDLLKRYGDIPAVAGAAVVSPIMNTGVFLIGCYLFFYDTVAAWGQAAGFQNTTAYMFVGFVGINFLVEMAVNMVLSPVIVRVIRAAGSHNK